MPITLQVTGYGDAAHSALANAVARYKQAGPLSPVSVIVPSNYMGIAARRALAQRQGVAAVTFLTPYRLAELLGSAAVAADGKRPISTPILAAAVRAVLGREPGRFEGVHTHPATERSLVRAHRALSELPTDTLEKLSGASARTADVIRVYYAVNDLLTPRFSNERDLVDAAVKAMKSGAPILSSLGPAILFLPQRLTSNQIRLLQTLGKFRDIQIIAGVTGVPEADTSVRLAVEQLCSEQLGVTWSAPESITAAMADNALSVSDADDEVRHTLRRIVEASLEGIPFNRCAVLYGSHDPYARMIADALDAADIEWFGQSVRTTESSLLGRALLAMMALGDHDFSRHDVSAWLAAAPVRGAGYQPLPVAAWERVSRAAGVVAGIDQWKSRLERLAEDRNSDAQRLEQDEDQTWRARRFKQDAANAETLTAFITNLASDLRRGHSEHSWSGLAQWCRQLVRNYFGGEMSRNQWPTAEQNAAKRIDQAIDRLGDLDGIDPNPGVADFRKALELQLSDDLGLHGTFGQGVLVGPLSSGIGLELDRVIVLGLAEGTLPTRRREDPLLPDHIRTRVGSDLPTRSDIIHDTHRALLAVTTAAKHALFMFPRGDLRRNAQRGPSRWLLDTCEARDGTRPSAENLARSTGGWLAEVPSFIAGLRSTAFPAHLQEYDMRAVLDWAEDGHDLSKAAPVKERQELRRAVSLITGRYSNRFTRFDGNLASGLSDAARKALVAKSAVTSTSRLELWAKCPHAYFVRHVLGIDPVEDPEEQYQISPLELGLLIHVVLERWLKEALAASVLPVANEPYSDAAIARLTEIGIEETKRLEDRGLVGRTIYWQRHKQVFLADLSEFTKFDLRLRTANGASPIASELSFGLPGSARGPISIALPDGRSLSLRGAIDRVDEDTVGNLAVIDYKTGSARNYENLDQDPLRGGTSLQLLLYALAARQLLDRASASTFGSYWMVTRKGEFKPYGYPITPELEVEGLSIVARIISGIESGLFPAHPAPPQFRPWVDCHFCEPDGLGLSHQYADWMRKSSDPELLPYLEITGEDDA